MRELDEYFFGTRTELSVPVDLPGGDVDPSTRASCPHSRRRWLPAGHAYVRWPA